MGFSHIFYRGGRKKMGLKFNESTFDYFFQSKVRFNGITQRILIPNMIGWIPTKSDQFFSFQCRNAFKIIMINNL